MKSPFPDDGKQHSPIIGFAFDGFPVYGPYEESGVMAKDLKPGSKRTLDVCNGHFDELRGYHYHVTPGRFPYTFGGYKGIVEPSNNHELRRSRVGAIENNAKTGNQPTNVITSVRPGTASRGKSHEIQIELNPENSHRRPVPPDNPVWVQIGPFEAKSISREGNILTAKIDIPEDAALGVFLDCHVEFASRNANRPVVFKLNDAFRVIE